MNKGGRRLDRRAQAQVEKTEGQAQDAQAAQKELRPERGIGLRFVEDRADRLGEPPKDRVHELLVVRPWQCVLEGYARLQIRIAARIRKPGG